MGGDDGGVTDGTGSRSGIRIDDRRWGRYVDISPRVSRKPGAVHPRGVAVLGAFRKVAASARQAVGDRHGALSGTSRAAALLVDAIATCAGPREWMLFIISTRRLPAAQAGGA